MSKHSPREGNLRVRKKFAWIPFTSDDGFMVWLSFYFQYEEYRIFPPTGPIGGLFFYQWVKVKRNFLPGIGDD